MNLDAPLVLLIVILGGACSVNRETCAELGAKLEVDSGTADAAAREIFAELDRQLADKTGEFSGLVVQSQIRADLAGLVATNAVRIPRVTERCGQLAALGEGDGRRLSQCLKGSKPMATEEISKALLDCVRNPFLSASRCMEDRFWGPGGHAVGWCADRYVLNPD